MQCSRFRFYLRHQHTVMKRLEKPSNLHAMFKVELHDKNLKQ